ncbi:lytic transglycosylase domain-containing protein [Terrabacter sp. AAH1]
MVRIVRAGTTARRVAAAVPVIALATAGIAFAATRGSDQTTAPTSITVPDTAITQGSPTYPQAGPAPAPMQLPPIYQTFTQDYARVDVPSEARAAITAIGSFAPVRLDANGIPSVAVAAYQRAAGVLSGIKPGCGIDWALLGAIGRVESNHARFGGNVLDASGIARPGIIGIPLDGSRGTARITDTDGGALDRDTTFDRAVGPMQFIPTSWQMAGRDGDGDGVANPQSLTDAVTGAGVLLCSGGTDLRTPGAAYQAVMRYNHSDSYVRTVLSIADAYRRGVTVVPMNALPAARPASGTGSATPEGSGFAYAGSPAPRSTASPSARPTPSASAKPSPSGKPSSTKPAPKPAPTPAPKPAPAPNKPAPGVPLPLPTVPGVPLPSVTVPKPTVKLPSATLPAEIVRLLALPHLPLLPGDPKDLVRVLDPLKGTNGTLVCVLDNKVVTCPSGGLLG